ncbi:B- and T-lymphocyte attenuator-like isoform X1 [Lates japonicus]|uniref:B- and T-lymphocyte attenuator-like isoform X1 n=1 Tax=Lates japonicus TaxID=270547 RepID=A0AAD3MY84_LATJO|nr:B- and T-lymphocyte attenuator-like isoform X1 [Lates japonicus]
MTGAFHSVPIMRPYHCWTVLYVSILAALVLTLNADSKSKKETQTESQYIAIPMVGQPFLDVSPQPAPRESPSAPPPRRSTRRKAAPSQLPRHNERICDGIKENRERQRNVEEEEGSSVVYAALNHQLPPGAAARPRRPQEEFSEYAAIRVS